MQNIGTLITAPIRPNDSQDPIASAFANELKGGHHSYETLAQRNAIIGARRDWGMLCTIGEEDITYQLKRGHVSDNILDNGNWILFKGNEEKQGSSLSAWHADKRPYALGAFVTHKDILWESTIADNTIEPASIDPSTGKATTAWAERSKDSLSHTQHTDTGTTSVSFELGRNSAFPFRSIVAAGTGADVSLQLLPKGASYVEMPRMSAYQNARFSFLSGTGDRPLGVDPSGFLKVYTSVSYTDLQLKRIKSIFGDPINPSSIYIDVPNARYYVANSNTGNYGTYVFDLLTDALIAILNPSGSTSIGQPLFLCRYNNHLYFTETNGISRYELNSYALEKYRTEYSLFNLDINPLTGYMYYTTTAGRVKIHNLNNNLAVKTLTGFSIPYCIRIDTRYNQYFVADRDNNRVSVYDLSTDNLMAQITGAFVKPSSLLIDHSANRLLVGEHTTSSSAVTYLTVIDLSTLQVLGKIAFPALSDMAQTFFDGKRIRYYIASLQNVVASSIVNKLHIYIE